MGVGDPHRPLSEVPTASSIYSQPSPEMTHTMPTNGHPLRSSSLYPEEISPSESLHTNDEGNANDGRDSPNVSPISGTQSPSATPQSPVSTLGRFNSNLPVPRKTRKFWNRPGYGTPEQGSSTTHWDVYSGEPTTSEKGKPPSTTPSAVKLHSDPSPARLNGYGSLTHISAGTSASGNVIGRKRVASRDLNNNHLIRPEWRGAGGRHKIVNPLLDKPLPPGVSASFPAGSEKYLQEQRERERTAQERNMASTRRDSPAPQRASEKSRPRQSSTVLDNQDLEEIRASPVDRYESSSGDVTPPASQQNLPSRKSSLTTEDTRSPLARNPSNEEITDRRSQPLPNLPQNTATEVGHLPTQMTDDHHTQSKPSANSISRSEEHDPSQIESRFRADLEHMHLQDEPPSRFSATTYATTTYESPPATPEIGSSSPSTSTTPNSILNRKRPVAPTGLPNGRMAARKPTPSEMRVTAQASPPPPPPSSESMRKSLPKSPPEVNAISRVAGLQAKLDNLKRRKNNLQTVIHELTHVVQPSSIAYDMASRQEIKRTVESLNNELADVLKDEHETGLKLHRAKKRDDEFAAYEPTSIWVRRVTS